MDIIRWLTSNESSQDSESSILKDIERAREEDIKFLNKVIRAGYTWMVRREPMLYSEGSMYGGGIVPASQSGGGIPTEKDSENLRKVISDFELLRDAVALIDKRFSLMIAGTMIMGTGPGTTNAGNIREILSLLKMIRFDVGNRMEPDHREPKRYKPCDNRYKYADLIDLGSDIDYVTKVISFAGANLYALGHFGRELNRLREHAQKIDKKYEASISEAVLPDWDGTSDNGKHIMKNVRAIFDILFKREVGDKPPGIRDHFWKESLNVSAGDELPDEKY